MERVSERCVMVAEVWTIYHKLDPEKREEVLFGSMVSILMQLWKDDDMMDQDTLFGLQQDVATYLMHIAEKSPEKQQRISKKFPWIFKQNQEDL